MCIRHLKDGETEEYNQYYQILSISGNELYVISFAGSPLPIETTHVIEQIQKAHIAVLNQKIAFQQQMIQQYKTELLNAQESNEKIVAEYAERLNEVTALRDHYRQMVAEISQMKSEYENGLNELLSSVRSYK